MLLALESVVASDLAVASDHSVAWHALIRVAHHDVADRARCERTSHFLRHFLVGQNFSFRNLSHNALYPLLKSRHISCILIGHWPYRLVVRTEASQALNRGSTPRRVTNRHKYPACAGFCAFV